MPDSESTLTAMLKSLRTLPHIAKAHYTIAKKGAGVVSLDFTPIQMRILYLIWRLLEKRSMAHLVLVKPRQIMATTAFNAMSFKMSMDIPGLRTFICTHKAAVTKEVRDNMKRYQSQMPAELSLDTVQNNDEAIEWKNLSKIGYGVAGTDSARGFPCLILHPSELGRYNERHTQDFLEGAMNAHAGAEKGNMILAESTSGGEGNYFHEIATAGWMNPRSSWFTAFFGWNEFPEYRLPVPKGWQPDSETIRLMEGFEVDGRLVKIDEEQGYWRCVKLYEKMRGDLSAFQREFPLTFQEAFAAAEGRLVEHLVLMNALDSETELDPAAPRVLGVDPAGGGDRTALVERQGWVIDKYQTYPRMDASTLAEIIIKRIDSGEIDHMFIDMGYGHGTYDIVVKRGYGQWITGIHFGSRANNHMLYEDKRSEMAGDFSDWIHEGPDNTGGTARIPNSEEFCRDIRLVPKLVYQANRKFKLASKEEIKALLKKSPDIFDATILTFAGPVRRKRNVTMGNAGAGQRRSMLETNNIFRELQRDEQKVNPNFKYYSYPRPDIR